MNFEHTGLVLEGGGLRGVYTAGVLRFFMEKELYFPYVIGVSMGACNAANYISRQPERNRIVNIRYVNEFRYLSYCRLFMKGELFGMDFIFDTIPNILIPFDYETFKKNKAKCITVVMDCSTGKPIYYEKDELEDDYLKILQASCSLPFIAKPVYYKGLTLMDGGLADSIPVRRSIDDGNDKNVLILTRPEGYRKKVSHYSLPARLFYPGYKGLQKNIKNRHINYNKTMDLIDQEEQKGNLFVIRPRFPINAGRVERNKDKLYMAYDQGYYDAAATYGKLQSYLE